MYTFTVFGYSKNKGWNNVYIVQGIMHHQSRQSKQSESILMRCTCNIERFTSVLESYKNADL